MRRALLLIAMWRHALWGMPSQYIAVPSSGKDGLASRLSYAAVHRRQVSVPPTLAECLHHATSLPLTHTPPLTHNYNVYIVSVQTTPHHHASSWSSMSEYIRMWEYVGTTHRFTHTHTQPHSVRVCVLRVHTHTPSHTTQPHTRTHTHTHTHSDTRGGGQRRYRRQ